MELALIDDIAQKGETPFHRASPAAKVLLTLLVVIVVINTQREGHLLSILFLLTSAVLLCGFPFQGVAHFLFFPAFFGSIFSLAGIGGMSTLLVILRAVTAAAAMLFLVVTTPLPRLLGLFQWIMPSFFTDSLFLIYRSFFLLLENLNNLMITFRLRGGFATRGLWTNLLHLGPVIGVLLLNALDSMERLYWVLLLRGRGSRLWGQKNFPLPNRYDFFPVLFGFIILVVVNN